MLASRRPVSSVPLLSTLMDTLPAAIESATCEASPRRLIRRRRISQPLASATSTATPLPMIIDQRLLALAAFKVALRLTSNSFSCASKSTSS